MNIGVFDSGIGGLSVAKAIKKAFPKPDYSVEFVNDSPHMPYGDKTPAEMLALSLAILEPLAERSDVIVIACNTLTTNIIKELRRQLTVPLIGLEPMVKPAVQQTKTGVIAVYATPATLKSPGYAELKRLYASNVQVLEPDCSHWARMIEANNLGQTEIKQLVDEVCSQKADVIVLGCTHYHWIEAVVNEAAEGRAIVIHPEQAAVQQLHRVLETLTQTD